MFEEKLTSREERSEIISMWVTPKVKKDFAMASDNKELQDKIISNYIKSESDWLESEMKEIDESVIKYRAKLITIREKFKEANSSYVDEIEGIYNSAATSLNKIDSLSETLTKKMDPIYNKIKDISSKIGYINVDRLERLLDVTERFGKLSKDEKSLISLILKSK